MKKITLCIVLLFAGSANAGLLTLDYSNVLDNQLADPSSNFHPQGLGYDTGSNELLFIQQSSNTIYRTDLFGSITGSRTIGSTPYTAFGHTATTAHHTTSVAGDGVNYYFTDYTANSNGYDLYSLGVSSGSAGALSSEVAAYGGYPIDVRDGLLYRTETSSAYSWANLNEIRISDLNSVDSILSTVILDTTFGIGDIAIDSARNEVWTLDYLSSAALRKFDLTTGDLLESFDLGLDGLTAGLTYANNTLYYYDWNSGSGSTLSAYSMSSVKVPEPGSIALLAIGIAGLSFTRRRKNN